MKITKTKIPGNSLLFPNLGSYNYIDSYEGTVNDRNNVINIMDVGKAFFKPNPKWVDGLLILRNKIVSLFGLKTTKNINNTEKPGKLKFEPGEHAGIFRVFDRTKDEIILGENDKHLDFRLSLHLAEYKNDPAKKVITATTVVKFNNWFGRLYFFPVKPFHKLIISITLKNDLQELELAINSPSRQILVHEANG